jgi:DHA2 family multidrug resistance protein
MIPGTMVAIVGMVLAKKLLEAGVNPKVVILSGLSLTMLFLVIMSYSSPDSSSSNFFWPFIIRGIGSVMMIMPVMDLAVTGLTGKTLAQAVGLSNMLRQLGGAIGVALMNIYINHENAFVRANMTGNINEFNDISTDRLALFTQLFINQGYDANEATSVAYRLLDNSLTKQQLLVSYNHGFLFVAYTLLICVPVILMIRYKKVQKKQEVITDAH